MEIAVQAVIALAASVGSLAMILIWIELTKFRLMIQSAPLQVIIEHQDDYSSTYGPVRHGESHAGYGIYIFRNGVWELESDLSTPGYEPSPPVLPGQYEGQAIKKQSVLKA